MFRSCWLQVHTRLRAVSPVVCWRVKILLRLLPRRVPVRRWSLAFAAVLLALLHGASYWNAGPLDDDFICQVFGRSLLEGRGFSWWGAEQVEGFTVPLWVGLQALGQGLGFWAPDVSRVLGVLGAGLAVWALGRAWGARTGSRSGGPAWILAAAPAFAFHACAGLGTSLLSALIALWLMALVTAEEGDEAHRCHAQRLAGVWLGLACLLRQECALLWLVWMVVAPREEAERRGLVRWLPKGAGIPFLALVSWSALRWFLFGRLLPISYSVKALPMAVDLTYGLDYLLGDLAMLGSGLLALAAVLLVLGTSARPVDRVIGWGFLVYAFYVVVVGGDFIAWSRFFVPAVPLGLWSAAVLVRRWQIKPLGLGLLCVVLQWPAVLPDQDLHSRGARFLDHQVFEERWSLIGRWVGEHAPEGTRLGTSPIGAIAWYSGIEVLDLLGLVHGHSLGLEPDLERVKVKGHHRSATNWMLEERPHWILLGNGMRVDGRLEINPWEVDLYQSAKFQDDYRRIEIDLGQGPPLDLFVRRDLPDPGRVR